MRIAKIDAVLGVTLAAMALAVGACGSSSSNSSSNANLPTKIGKTEGELNLIAWEGYVQPEWTKPFEEKTGCKVHAKYAGSSDEMVALMRQSGESYDMVSASGDASLRLIRGGNVQPMNVALVPEWKNFIPALQSPPHNTVNGVHYGISLQWGPNMMLYNTHTFHTAPTSWETIYSPKYKGQITIPNNPIQIADVALYLSKKDPSLGITNPYELTEPQLDAAVKLLKEQHPLIKKYWDLASDEIELFKNGDVVVGPAWPYQYSTLKRRALPWAKRSPPRGPPVGPTHGCSRRTPSTPTVPTNGSTGSRVRKSRPSRRSPTARHPRTPRPAPKWKRSRRAHARSTTRTRRRPTSTRSSSGARRSRIAATGRTTAWTTALATEVDRATG